jgi:hypothetical protein
MEPLIVALQILVGEDYNAPQEVVEVAKDVLKRIEEKSHSSSHKNQKNLYPLRTKSIQYKAPFDSEAEDEWDVIK